MKVLLFQLSDIHIRENDDAVLSRSASIVDAIKNIEPEVDAAVCLLSGDVTFSGTEEQYLIALDFVDKIKSGLEKEFNNNIKLSFVAVPGNHDCNLEESTGARDIIMNSVLDAPHRLTDASFINICLAPQRPFFEFREAICTLPKFTPTNVDERIYTEYRLKHKGEIIVFCCGNTASLSKLHEQPGSLTFPTGVIPNRKDAEVLSIGVIHHPTQWLEPNCARDFRKRFEAITDLIFTGHEHVLDKRKTGSQEYNNLYLEGGVLQDSNDPKTSEFYAVILDTSAKKQRIIGFSWNGKLYNTANLDDPKQYYLWEELFQNRLRSRDLFQITPTFSAYLEDPEVILNHRIKGQLKLSDVYTFPDLKRVNLKGEKGSKIIKGEDVVGFTLQQPCMFIIGDDVSGKTALAKILFANLKARGDVPVFINASEVALSLGNYAELIEGAFIKIYGESMLGTYRQLDRIRRVLIIDDYHKLKLPAKTKIDLLRRLRSHSFRIIVFAHDLELTFQDLAESGNAVGEDSPFVYYSILPMGFSRRDRLIEKWLLLSGDIEQNTSTFVQNLEQIIRTINTLVGKNYVPAHPSYILAVLQATEAGTDIDLEASTHGYLYELFIKAALSRQSDTLSFNTLFAYLSHVAYRMFKSEQSTISEIEFRALHGELEEEYEVIPNFDHLVEKLISSQMLSRINDFISFRQPYIYYYFLALYLHNHLANQQTVEEVKNLSSQMYKEENANTLLFLTHLSKNRVVLDMLLDVAESQYFDVHPIDLGEDVNFLNQLNGKVGKLKLPNKSIPETREQYQRNLEIAQEEELRFEREHKADIENEKSYLSRLNASLKTIQVLGQLLKNFPADLKRQEKDRVINACCSLGRRAFGEFLQMVQRNQTAILEDMLFLIGRRQPGIDSQTLRSQAVSTVVGLCELASIGFVSRLSNALGSSRLTTTYDRIFTNFNQPIMRLVYVALNLDHYTRFPEELIREQCKELHKNPFTFRVLRHLVVRYLTLFPTDFRLKQRLSDELQLDYQKIRKPKSQQKLLE